MPSYAQYKGDAKYTLHRLKWVHENIPGLSAYMGKPCVYVRQLDDGTFYVGRSQGLHNRYKRNELQQVIYFEEFDSNQYTSLRERELIREFAACGFKLANGRIHRRKITLNV